MSLRTGFWVAALLVILAADVSHAEPLVSASGFIQIPDEMFLDIQAPSAAQVNSNIFADDGSPATNATAAPNGFVATQAFITDPSIGAANAIATASWTNTFALATNGGYSLNFNVQPITLAIDPIALAASAFIDLEISIQIDGTGGFDTLYRLQYGLDANGLTPGLIIDGSTNTPLFDDDGKDGTASAPSYLGTISLGDFTNGQTVTIQYVLSSNVGSAGIANAVAALGFGIGPGGTLAQVGDPFSTSGPSNPPINVTLNGPNDVNVPEPSSWLLFVCGGVALVAARRFTGLRSV